jgi:hypothetical protein
MNFLAGRTKRASTNFQHGRLSMVRCKRCHHPENNQYKDECGGHSTSMTIPFEWKGCDRCRSQPFRFLDRSAD